MKCKFCRNNDVFMLNKIQSPYVDREYSLFQCKSCKSRFFDLGENEVDIERLYEKYSVSHDKDSASFKKSFYWKRQVKRIEKILGRKILSVLDIGCRTGDFLMQFPDNVLREGVELSKKASEIAVNRGLNIYSDFAENIHFDKQYDIVTCYAVLEHLLEPLNILRKFEDMVSSGGVLVIMIPTHECLKRWLIDTFTERQWYMYSPPLHLNLFSKAFLDRRLGKNFKLADRYWTSGGMFNPFRKIPLAGYAFKANMALVDEYFPTNKLPVFDHLYSYYVKTS